jgi:hypothetical protein
LGKNEISFWQFAKSASFGVKLKLGAVMLVGLGATGFSAFVIWKIVAGQPGPVRKIAVVEPKAETTPTPAKDPDPFRYEYDLKKISMPLSDREGRRTGTAQFSVSLDLPTNQSLHWMELNRAKLLTITFDVGAHFTFEDLEAKGGLDKFKAQLESAYHDEFGVYAPNQVALRDWVTN